MNVNCTAVAQSLATCLVRKRIPTLLIHITTKTSEACTSVADPIKPARAACKHENDCRMGLGVAGKSLFSGRATGHHMMVSTLHDTLHGLMVCMIEYAGTGKLFLSLLKQT